MQSGFFAKPDIPDMSMGADALLGVNCAFCKLCIAVAVGWKFRLVVREFLCCEENGESGNSGDCCCWGATAEGRESSPEPVLIEELALWSCAGLEIFCVKLCADDEPWMLTGPEEEGDVVDKRHNFILPWPCHVDFIDCLGCNFLQSWSSQDLSRSQFRQVSWFPALARRLWRNKHSSPCWD